MAAAINFGNFRAQDESDTKRRRLGDYTGPSAYVNGSGDPFVGADVGLGQIHVLLFEMAYNAATGGVYLLRWHASANANNGANCVTWFDPTTGLQVANGTNLSGYTAKFEAIGL